MRIFDALTYHACVAQAAPDHYVSMLHMSDDGKTPLTPMQAGEDNREHVVLHVKCMKGSDHEYNASYVLKAYTGFVGVFVTEKNPYPGTASCFRCKLY